MKAYIALVENSKLTEDMINAYCKNHFPNHKIPKEYEFLNSLPKNNSNKLDRVKLKHMHKEKLGN